MLTLGSELIVDTSDTKILEDFWEEHKSQDSFNDREPDSLLESPTSLRYQPIRNNPTKPKGHGRNRSASDGTALLPPGQNLSTYHPAWSLPRLLEIFGPLIFPIHRAALLRKRILITAHAPVEETCNFGTYLNLLHPDQLLTKLEVYDLSVLSNIPLAVSDLLTATAPAQRLRPLFSIGVHDIPLLQEDLRASKAAATTPDSENTYSRDEQGSGWIACTTDSILAMKSTLYDVLITMPPPYSEDAAEKAWPKVESPQGTEMKATQRDLRRYKALRWGLSRHVSEPSSPILARRTSSYEQEEAPRTASSSNPPRDDPMLDIPDTDAIVEPLSWSALAYSGFMWWASAGEQRLDSEEESEADSTLLSGLFFSHSAPQTPHNLNMSSTTLMSEGSAKQEMGIIAYFHRLTTLILTTLSDIVDVTDSDDERQGEGLVNGAARDETGPAVYVSSADVVRMGLDVWSATDHQFIEDVAREYFGSRAQVEGRSVDVCGIRIC